MNESLLYSAISVLFAAIVGFGKYTLNQKDAKIKELEQKNHDLVERLLRSRGKK